MKGVYFCEPSMPAGELREWLWSVFAREGTWLCVYCCAFVWIGCAGMVGTVVGAVYADEGTGLELTPGCSAPGTLPAFEGTMLDACEPCGVACCRLKAGGAFE